MSGCASTTKRGSSAPAWSRRGGLSRCRAHGTTRRFVCWCPARGCLLSSHCWRCRCRRGWLSERRCVHRVAARHGAWALWLPVAHGRRVVGACDRAPAGTGALVAVPFLLRQIATASRLKTASLHVRQPGAPARNHIQLQRAGAPAPAWNRHRSFSSGSIGSGRGVARTTSTPPLPPPRLLGAC